MTHKISSHRPLSAPIQKPAAGPVRQSIDKPAPAEVSDRVRLQDLGPLETPKKAVRKIVSGLGYAEFPQISPDGKTLIFNVVGDYATSQLMSVDPKGGKVRALDSGEEITPDNVSTYLTRHEGSIREQATWAGGESLLYRTNENGTFDIGRFNFADHSNQVVVSDPNLNLKHPVQMPDGTIACYGGPPGKEHPTTDLYSNLFIADPRNNSTHQITHSHGESAYKHPAPFDGVIVAHKEDRKAHDVSDLVMVNPASGKETPLTHTPLADERHPFFNDRVGLLVYHRKENGDKNLVLSTPDGSRSAQLTFYGKAAQSPCWSPDGKEIYFIKKLDKPAEGEPFYKRQADVRAIDVKDALKDLKKQAEKRLKKLEKSGAETDILELARNDLENYKYFLRRYH